MWTNEHRETHKPRSGRYLSDCTDAEWAIIEPMIPAARSGGRKRETDMREVCNAIRYIDRTGCQWRQLPREFPPHTTVYRYFWDWSPTAYSTAFTRRCLKNVGKPAVASPIRQPVSSIRKWRKLLKKAGLQRSGRLRRGQENQGHQAQRDRRHGRPPPRRRGDPGQYPGSRLRG